ncbi:MAG: hypothetical protein GXY07_01845 [Candidatus Hydrogenedentes bacterium]|nr:hypothetical protein [Candidatus Hydrogenedentota bacterium]
MVEHSDKTLRHIVYKVCVAATWSDSKMTIDEKHYLGYLRDTLAANEEERETFRQYCTGDIDTKNLFNEVSALGDSDKRYVIVKCLEVMGCDHKILANEAAFLNRLRKACGIRYFLYRRLIAATLGNRWVLFSISWKWFACYILFWAVLIGLLLSWMLKNQAFTYPEGQCSDEDIAIQVFDTLSIQTFPDKDETSVFESIKKGIVSINIFRGGQRISGGSGFVLGAGESERIYIITNRHVVEKEEYSYGCDRGSISYEVELHNMLRADAVMDYCSEDADLALLSAKGLKEHVVSLVLRLKNDLQVGMTVLAVGRPLSLRNTVTRGIISSLREEELQTDVAISYGSSGCPLINLKGEVCAVMNSSYDSKNFSFGVYTDEILTMLQKRKSLYEK